MLLFRKKIGSTWATEPADADYPYLADTSNPDAGQWLDVTSIEAWDLYGHFTTLTAAQVRDELKALYVSWAASTAAEKDVFSRWFIADKADRDTIHTDDEQTAFAEILYNALDATNNLTDLNAVVVSMVAGDGTASDSVAESVQENNNKIISQDFAFNGIYSTTSASYSYVPLQVVIPPISDIYPSGTKIEVKFTGVYNCDGAADAELQLLNFTDTIIITSTITPLLNASWASFSTGYSDITAYAGKTVRVGYKRVGGTGSDTISMEGVCLILKYS